MGQKKILKLLGAVIIAIILVYSFIPSNTISYPEKIELHRSEILDFFKFDEESPLSDSLKADFVALDYFDIDPAFKVRATLERIPGKEIMKVPTSDGKVREYTRYAYASFELNGKNCRVTLLKPIDENNLFLPFGDLSNGDSTYGGGRYIDLETTTQNKITIDFNLAYNPYCVYNGDYSCPLPPSENQLEVIIEAGEKDFSG